jgi:hypothetical protein
MKREGVVINANHGFHMTLVKQKSIVVETTKALLPKKAIVLMVVVEMKLMLLNYIEREVCLQAYQRSMNPRDVQHAYLFLGLGNVQLVVLSHCQQLVTCEETTS